MKSGSVVALVLVSAGAIATSVSAATATPVLETLVLPQSVTADQDGTFARWELDPTFGTGGVRTIGTTGDAYRIAVSSDNTLLVGGDIDDAGKIVELNPIDGTDETGFMGTGSLDVRDLYTTAPDTAKVRYFEFTGADDEYLMITGSAGTGAASPVAILPTSPGYIYFEPGCGGSPCIPVDKTSTATLNNSIKEYCSAQTGIAVDKISIVSGKVNVATGFFDDACTALVFQHDSALWRVDAADGSAAAPGTPNASSEDARESAATYALAVPTTGSAPVTAAALSVVSVGGKSYLLLPNLAVAVYDDSTGAHLGWNCAAGASAIAPCNINQDGSKGVQNSDQSVGVAHGYINQVTGNDNQARFVGSFPWSIAATADGDGVFGLTKLTGTGSGIGAKDSRVDPDNPATVWVVGVSDMYTADLSDAQVTYYYVIDTTPREATGSQLRPGLDDAAIAPLPGPELDAISVARCIDYSLDAVAKCDPNGDGNDDDFAGAVRIQPSTDDTLWNGVTSAELLLPGIQQIRSAAAIDNGVDSQGQPYRRLYIAGRIDGKFAVASFRPVFNAVFEAPTEVEAGTDPATLKSTPVNPDFTLDEGTESCTSEYASTSAVGGTFEIVCSGGTMDGYEVLYINATMTVVAPTPHLAADGTFAHAELNGCQYVDADGVVSDTQAVVDLDAKSISCGVENDLEIDLAGNEEDATTALNGQLVFFVEKEGVANGYGFKPGTTAEVWLASEPRFLGTVEVQEDGTWEKIFDVPGDIDDGVHTIQAEGIGFDGSDQAVNAGVMIQRRAPSSAELPTTGGSGSFSIGVMLIALGVAMTMALRLGRERVR